MKINILKSLDNKVKGWDIIPENSDETEVLATIRNSTFFGLEDNGTYPKYDGMESHVEDGHRIVDKLKYRIPRYNF